MHKFVLNGTYLINVRHCGISVFKHLDERRKMFFFLFNNRKCKLILTRGIGQVDTVYKDFRKQIGEVE